MILGDANVFIKCLLPEGIVIVYTIRIYGPRALWTWVLSSALGIAIPGQFSNPGIRDWRWRNTGIPEHMSMMLKKVKARIAVNEHGHLTATGKRMSMGSHSMPQLTMAVQWGDKSIQPVKMRHVAAAVEQGHLRFNGVQQLFVWCEQAVSCDGDVSSTKHR